MTYQSINFSIFPQVLSVLAVVFCGGVFALFMYFLYDKRFANVKNKDKINKAFIVLLIISAVILLVAIVWFAWLVSSSMMNKKMEPISVSPMTALNTVTMFASCCILFFPSKMA